MTVTKTHTFRSQSPGQARSVRRRHKLIAQLPHRLPRHIIKPCVELQKRQPIIGVCPVVRRSFIVEAPNTTRCQLITLLLLENKPIRM